MSNPPIQFGSTPATSGASTPSLFGASGSQRGVFGNVGANLQTTSTSATTPSFGAATSRTTQSGSLFGSLATNSPAAPFGKPQDQQPQNNPQPSTFSFFGTQTPKHPSEPSSSSGLMKPPGPLFGGTGGSNTTPTSLFGTTTPSSSGTNLFGSLSTTPAGPPPLSGGPSSLFGAQPTQKTDASSTTAATTSTPTTTFSPSGLFPSFGQPQQTSSPFGGSTPTTGGLFPAPAKDIPTGLGQGQPSVAASGAEPPKPTATPSLFGTTAIPSSSQPSGNLFALPTPADKPSQTLFGATTTTTTPTTTAPETAQKQLSSFGGGLLGSTSAPPVVTTTSTSSGNMFAGINTATTMAPIGSTTAPVTSADQPTSSLFPNLPKLTNTSAPPATISTVTASATASAPGIAATTTAPTTTTTTVAPNLSASTVGPAPPAQSRLKNKTMDEIITRWATDLTKYQKEFQDQAQQVAEWDRMLVENATKIQKLFGNTVDAERATQEVERQLASVESQQDELGSWLDRYEHEVESLLSKQVGLTDTLQGPDQERERTFKLAERLSDRLNEIGQDLTSIVEEVNSVSAKLNKTTKADEPISQIVRILNSHLSQLQQIDQGTAAIREKIAATQKMGSSLSGYQRGSSSFGTSRSGTPVRLGGGGGAVEDFYRAYMGKR